MKKILTMGLLAMGLVLANQHRAMAWSKFNFGVGLNIGYEGGGNSVLWGLLKGQNVPGAEMGAFGPGPFGPDHGHAMEPMGPSPALAGAPFGPPAFPGAPYGPNPAFGGTAPAGAGFGPGHGGDFMDPRFSGPQGPMPGAPGMPAAPAAPPRILPPAGPGVAQPVGYFPYADPAVGYYPGYYRYPYYYNSYYGPYAR